MGREIRRVPADWEHPKNGRGNLRPLFEPDKPLYDMAEDWMSAAKLWDKGEHPDQQRGYDTPVVFSDWDGGPPNPSDYMPWWPDEACTHFQMYETCSEGTPISPVLGSPEEVARWCADNGASSFGGNTASYDSWLAVAHGEFVPNVGNLIVVVPAKDDAVVEMVSPAPGDDG